MLYNLTFKKAFGIGYIPIDYATFLMEISKSECRFTIDRKEFTVKTGTFGESEEEKILISLFLHSDERDLKYINKIITLDTTFDVDLPIPEALQKNVLRNSEIDTLVAPFIRDAFSAVSRFIDAYRSAKYILKKGSKDWKKGKLLLIPEMTEAEFKTFLFYHLQNHEWHFLGSFSNGLVMISSSSDYDFITQQMQLISQDEIPLNSKLIVKAWEYWFQDDYRNSILYAATVLELTMIKTLRRIFLSKLIASESQIDKFLEGVSNRLLCTVILGLMKIGDEDLRNNIAKIFEIRNGLIHGKRKNVSRSDAEKVLNDTERLLEVLEQQNELIA